MPKKNHRGLFVRILLLILFAVGFWLRTLPTTKTASGETAWRPWTTTRTITLYFSDGRFLFPVSRRMQSNDDLPVRTLEALLAGPNRAGRLKNTIPPGVRIRSFNLDDGVAHIDLSAFPDSESMHAAETAIVQTMTAVRGVNSVELSIEGKTVKADAKRTPLLYFASAGGMVAVPAPALNPRDALERYLSGPPTSDLTGLPPDVRLLAYDYNSADRLLTLKFSYTPSLRTLAIDRPDRMRTVLLGLIASLTEFPEVRAVNLDFGGQTRLGLGQCSDLLRTPQPRPGLLNDERLL